jgi:hypothetical protein
MRWIAHEPPVLGVIGKNGQIYNSAKINPFKHHETEEMGLVFQHMSYTTEAQLRFKEEYYGYVGATKAWNALQLNNQPRILLRRYFNWVADFSIVESTANRGIKNLMKP